MTDSGVVVIDTGSSYEIGKMIRQKIATVTAKPVTHIFTTHIHGDHWLANQALVEAWPDARTSLQGTKQAGFLHIQPAF